MLKLTSYAPCCRFLHVSCLQSIHSSLSCCCCSLPRPCCVACRGAHPSRMSNAFTSVFVRGQPVEALDQMAYNIFSRIYEQTKAVQSSMYPKPLILHPLVPAGLAEVREGRGVVSTKYVSHLHCRLVSSYSTLGGECTWTLDPLTFIPVTPGT